MVVKIMISMVTVWISLCIQISGLECELHLSYHPTSNSPTSFHTTQEMSEPIFKGNSLNIQR